MIFVHSSSLTVVCTEKWGKQPGDATLDLSVYYDGTWTESVCK